MYSKFLVSINYLLLYNNIIYNMIYTIIIFVCRSWVERFTDAEQVDSIIAELSEKDKPFW